ETSGFFISGGCRSFRLALRLAGLQFHRCPRSGSPGKACTPQPGIPGHEFVWFCGVVARIEAQHRLRQIRQKCGRFTSPAALP
ncbi:hypothetical protein FMK81_27675, partial [Klebsiella oxytoca]|nr:hypothetical protein [Klebsiella oxytoca]MBZ7713425.1 hypothetical protein [Klebsiella oxytoca]